MTHAAAVLADRVLTELDHVRLSRHLQREGGSAGHHLADLLDNATVVPGRKVPADVATMYSTLLVQEDPAAPPRKLTLCYPPDAEPALGFISVMSPAGSALIGLPVGATARWALPDGSTARARLLRILFQPEASGDYTL